MGDYSLRFRVSVTPFLEKGVSEGPSLTPFSKWVRSGTVCFGRYETRFARHFRAEDDVAFEEKKA